MSMAVTAWLIVTVLLGVIATFAIWARGMSRARGHAVAAFVAASPIAAGALGASLGWPIPLLNGVTAPAGEWIVLGQKMIVGKGIYLLLDVSDGEPRYFYLPWSRQMADKLQELLNEGEQPMVVVPPYEFSWDQNPPSFQPMPQPKMLPEKPAQEAPQRYERSA